MRLRIGFLILVAALAGCGKRSKSSGPSCRQIVSYMMRMPGIGEFDQRSAIDECRKQNWTAKQRQCLYTAKDFDAMSACVPPIKLDRPDVKLPRIPDWHPPVHEPIRGASDGPAPKPAATIPDPGAAGAAMPAPPTPTPAAPAPAPAAPASK